MKLNGLRLDGNFSDSTPNTWAHAKNILISRGFDEVVNEKGVTAVATLTTTGDIIDIVATQTEHVAFINEAGVGTIKRISSTGVVTTILSSSFYDLTPDVNGVKRYIEAIYYYNNIGHLILAWTDGLQNPMIADLDNMPPLVTPDDITKLYLFPQFKDVNITGLDIQSGGSLPTSAYYLAIAYELENELLTNFGHISNPIFIIVDDATGSYKSVQGNPSEETTNKSILATFSNLDDNYKYFKVAVIKTSGIATTCYLSKHYRITGANVSVVISDLDQLTLFDIENVLISNPAFETITTMTVCNNRLRIGNVSTFEKLPIATVYDNIINHVNLQWISEKDVNLYTAKDSYKDGVFTFFNREFKSGEVYAFYLGIRLKTGGFYGIYHIPGRIAIGTEATATVSVDGDTVLDYKLNTKGATLAGNYYGNFGYWQNENETYDNKYGTILANSKVRHHKFPTAGQIATWKGDYVKNISTSDNVISGNCYPVFNLIPHPLSLYTEFYFKFMMTSNVMLNRLSITAVPSPGDRRTIYTSLLQQTLTININNKVTLQDYNLPTVPGYLTLLLQKITKAGTVTQLFTQTVTDIGTFTGTVIVNLNAGDQLACTWNGISGINGLRSNVVFDSNTHTTISSADIIVKPTASILGVKLTIDYLNIPSDIRNQLEKYADSFEIFYAKRTNDNMTQIDQSITLLDPILDTRFRFYGFDSMSNQLNINPDYAKSEFEVIIDTDVKGTSQYASEVNHWTKLATPIVSKINEIDYLLPYNMTQDNKDYENCFVLTPTVNTFDKKITSLITIKGDVFIDFTKQELVSTGVIFPIGSAIQASLYGGDTYINAHSFLTNPSANGQVNGYDTMIWYTPTENVLNAGLRYDSDLDYEKFYPKTDISLANYDENGDYSMGAESFTSANWIDEGDGTDNDDWGGSWSNGFKHGGEKNSVAILTNDFSPIRNYFYQISYIITEWTTGSVDITFGGANISGIYETSAKIVQAKNADIFTVTPTGDFNGRIHFSLKVLSGVFDMQLQYIIKMIVANVANYYIYNNNYHSLNTFKQDTIDNDLTKTISKYPYRIYSSQEQSKESDSTYYRIFKALDYTNIPATDGKIHKLFSTDAILYIKTEYGLYRGLITDQLDAANISVGLKTVDIFDRPVQKAFEGDGQYIRSFNRNDAILTPYGLFCVDRYNGTVFLFDDKGNELSKIGIEDWLRQTLKNTMTFSTVNTYNSGIQLAYDDEYKRVLMTILNSNTSIIAPLTLSFNFETNYWVCFHTYTPAKYTNNANGVFGIINKVLYKLNSGNYGRYDDVNYSDSSIDFIFNSNADRRFLVNSVVFTSNIELNDVKYWDQTLSQIMIYSKNLCTGTIDLVKREVIYDEGSKLAQNGNVKFQDGEWLFNDISDLLSTPNSKFLDANFNIIQSAINYSKNWYDKSKFISKFIIVRLIFTNNNNKKLTISDVNINAKSIL